VKTISLRAVAVALAGMSAIACFAPEPIVRPSVSVLPDCAVSPRLRIDPNVRLAPAVAGTLATNAESVTTSGSYDLTLWSVRGASPLPALRLTATRQGDSQSVSFSGTPYTYDNESGLLDWGPTYFVGLTLPSAGCWNIRASGAPPEDAIVIKVTPPRP
jgi:hypothetical protein